MIFQYNDYREFLRDFLSQRKQRNPSYSLRAFALSMDISVSTLSDILRGNKNLTMEAAEKSLLGLKLSSAEAQYFQLMVQRDSLAPDSDTYVELTSQMSSLVAQAHRKKLDAIEIKSLTRSLAFALIELGGIESFELTVSSAAKALLIEEPDAKSMLETLVASGLLVELSGRYQKNGTGVLASSDTVNISLREFHIDMMERAKQSLVEQPPAERFIGSETFAFDTSQLMEANEITEEFFSKMIALANKSRNKNSVYHLGIQMFRLTQSGVIQ